MGKSYLYQRKWEIGVRHDHKRGCRCGPAVRIDNFRNKR